MEELIKEIKEAIDAEKLITARLVDSVSRTAQLAGGTTPEMQELFTQWISLITSQIMRECKDGEIDLPNIAEKIGVKETTLLSLLLSMQRSGKLRIGKIAFLTEGLNDDEVCNCLRQQ